MKIFLIELFNRFFNIVKLLSWLINILQTYVNLIISRAYFYLQRGPDLDDKLHGLHNYYLHLRGEKLVPREKGTLPGMSGQSGVEQD